MKERRNDRIPYCCYGGSAWILRGVQSLCTSAIMQFSNCLNYTLQSPIYPLVHAKHFHRVPTSTVIIVVAETVTSAVTYFCHRWCCLTLSAHNENTHGQVSQSLLLSKSKGRVHTRRSQGLFTGWFYIQDNSNEVSLQRHSFSDDDRNDEENNNKTMMLKEKQRGKEGRSLWWWWWIGQWP